MNHRTSSYLFLIILVVFSLSGRAVVAAELIELSDETRARCLEVLREGLKSDDFWPSMHAAEGLTLGGHGEEVITFLEPKLLGENDDQRRCGLARELVRAGRREYTEVLLDILASDDPHGHVHAAESLYKVVEIGDGSALRHAFAQSPNITLRVMAAAALGRCGNPEAMAFLRERLVSAEPSIARIVGWVLGRIGSSQDIPGIRRRLENSEDDGP
jgi:sialidase-1